MKKHRLSWCLLWSLLPGLALGSPASRLNPNVDYWARRDGIIAEEVHSSLGGKLRFRDGELAANDILMAANQEEIDRGFKNVSTFLPARNFLTVYEDIRRSPTFQIIRKMPKGAVLHVHSLALVSADFIYENVTFREHLHICRSEAGSIAFRFLRSADNDTSCTSPMGWELLADLRANATIAEDVNTTIRKAILTFMVPDPDTAYLDADAAWVACGKYFLIIRPLLTYLPVFSDYYYQGLAELREDNVHYLELRTSLRTLYDLDGNMYGPLDIARICKTTTDRFVNDYPDFIGTKLIFAPRRKVTTTQLDEYLETAAALKKEFPDFVAGFDLVGQEDKGMPLMRFANKLMDISPDIRLFFHAGETNWNGLSTDENLIDAVLLNTTRIGHGHAILKHPKVLELARKHKIAIEVNSISNQVLKLIDDMRNHPASVLFAQDFPAVVSSDDLGVWGAVGLSYDFYEAFVGIISRSADIRALKQLAMNSIKYSAMSSDEKIRAFAMWEQKWTTFITDLVQDNIRSRN